MNRPEFEHLIAEEFPKAIPEKFQKMVKNVAFLVEEKPSREVRREEGLAPNETLLGLYHGVPRAQRGDYYGVGPTLPDVIILFRLPIHDEAQTYMEEGWAVTYDEALRKVVHETIWHEVAHYLGFGEEGVQAREEVRRAESAGAAAQPPAPPAAEPHEMSSQDVFDLLPKPKNLRAESVRPTHPSLDPIEVEKEDPELQRKLHQPLMPASQNFSSIDPEGGGNGIKNWWDEKPPQKPAELTPEERLPKPSKSDASGEMQKKGEPPPNLPTLEE